MAASSSLSLVEQFQREGFILIPDALTETQCTSLRNIIDNLDRKRPSRDPSRHTVHKAVFEQYPAPCLEVFKNPKILGVVRALLSMAGTSRNPDKSLTAHVIHNNAYRVDPGMRGQAPTWHTDDPPLFSGELPPNVHISPLVLTCMYYLNDIHYITPHTLLTFGIKMFFDVY